MQGFEGKTKHQQKQSPLSLLGSGKVYQRRPLPSLLGGAKRKLQFLSCFQFSEVHTLYLPAGLSSVEPINSRSACPVFLVLFFSPWIEYRSLPIILPHLVAAGYLCSSIEHIREQKPRRMVSKGTAVAKEVEIHIYRCITRFESEFFRVLMSQLPSVMLGGE